MTRKPKLKSFIVRLRSTVIEDYVIDAKDEDDARARMEQGEGELSQEIERPDMEVINVEPNE